MKIGCIIMASGLGKRFGSNKLLQEFGGKTLLQRILESTTNLFDKRVVVTRSEEVNQFCRENKVEVIFHDLPNRNQAVKLGIEQMKNMDGCMFCPCDQPFLKRESMERLKISFEYKKSGIHRLVYEDHEGSPVLFGKEYFRELQELPLKSGGSYLVGKYPAKVEKIEAACREELLDIDTKEDLEKLKMYIK